MFLARPALSFPRHSFRNLQAPAWKRLSHPSHPPLRLFSITNMASTAPVPPARAPDAPGSLSVSSVKKDAHPWDRASLEGVLAKRFFYNQSFEIYGGTWLLKVRAPVLNECHFKVSPVSTTMGPLELRSKPTSSLPGATISSWRKTCSKLTRPS